MLENGCNCENIQMELQLFLRSHYMKLCQREWLVARKELLTKEKELNKLRDQLNAERGALPWAKVTKSYLFDAADGSDAC